MGNYLHEVGGVLVYVCGQEVLHGSCVEHAAGGAGSIGLSGSGGIEAVNFDAWYGGLFLDNPRGLILIWRHGC